MGFPKKHSLYYLKNTPREDMVKNSLSIILKLIEIIKYYNNSGMFSVFDSTKEFSSHFNSTRGFLWSNDSKVRFSLILIGVYSLKYSHGLGCFCVIFPTKMEKRLRLVSYIYFINLFFMHLSNHVTHRLKLYAFFTINLRGSAQKLLARGGKKKTSNTF